MEPDAARNAQSTPNCALSTDEGKESSSEDVVLLEAIRLLAPLLSEEQLKPFDEHLPGDCRLTLDERIRKFRDDVSSKWSRGRYDVG